MREIAIARNRPSAIPLMTHSLRPNSPLHPRSRQRSGRLLEVPAAEEFGDLDGVQRRALAEVVADHPDAEAVFDRRVLADPADKVA